LECHAIASNIADTLKKNEIRIQGPKLSICICHLVERERQLKNILGILHSQYHGDDVEILIETDNREKSLGAKRQMQLLKSCGEYVCCIDDDDEVDPEYISLILEATKSGADCIGMRGYIVEAGKKKEDFIHTLKSKEWYQDDKTKNFYRTPNHLNPIKREIALKVGYKDLGYAEDFVYSQDAYPLLRTEVFIEKPLYFYIMGNK